MSRRGSSFGYWIKRRREALDLTQRELAQAVGCSKVAIQKIESGERKPSKQIADLLATHLKIPPEERAAFVRVARSESQAPSASGAASSELPPWRLRRPTNLPAPLTAILGREDELEQAADLLLGQGVRLLTLTGAPGIGKTRLAIQIATALLDDFEDGSFFVSLAAIADPNVLPGEIARAMGLEPADGRPALDRLTAALRDRRMLLVLDNFEQVVSGAPLVNRILESCRHVKALVTSREPLRVRGEYLLPVLPLAVPDRVESEPADRLTGYPAVTLFAQRARAVDHRFRLTAETVVPVAEICIRLDGIPLAIELAAARLHNLSLGDVLAGMSHRLDAAAGDLRDEPLRHRTLRQAIAWSYDLLGPAERTAFESLGVFAGGFAVEAARAVLPAGAEEGRASEPGADTGLLLQSLVAKGLLQVVDEGIGPRFVQLEVLREFSLECLVATGREPDVRRRHAGHFAAFADACEGELVGQGQMVALRRMETDLDNLRAALGWAITAHRADLALCLGAALGRFWYMRGLYAEGRQWLSRVLAMETDDVRSLARIALRSGWLAEDQGELDLASDSYARSLDLARAAEDDAAVADALSNLGALTAHRGDFDRAQTLHEGSLGIRRRLGDRRGVSISLVNLGMVAANVGKLDLAQRYYEESLEIDRELGDGYGEAITLSNLGATAHDLGDHARAMEYHTQSLAIRRELGDRGGVARSLNHLGTAACNLGDFRAGWNSFRESLDICLQIGDRKGMVDSLELIAWAEASIGSPRRGAELLGAAQALRDALGIPLQPSERSDYEKALRLVEAKVSPDAFQTAWTAGRGIPLPQVVASLTAAPSPPAGE